MALYEHVFLARQDVSSQQVEALVEQYKGVIEANGGKVGWGLKSPQYRINKNRKAHFSLMNIDAPAGRDRKWSARCASMKTCAALHDRSASTSWKKARRR
jgi:ribosomal protein S6